MATSFDNLKAFAVKASKTLDYESRDASYIPVSDSRLSYPVIKLATHSNGKRVQTP